MYFDRNNNFAIDKEEYFCDNLYLDQSYMFFSERDQSYMFRIEIGYYVKTIRLLTQIN